MSINYSQSNWNTKFVLRTAIGKTSSSLEKSYSNVLELNKNRFQFCAHQFNLIGQIIIHSNRNDSDWRIEMRRTNWEIQLTICLITFYQIVRMLKCWWNKCGLLLEWKLFKKILMNRLTKCGFFRSVLIAFRYRPIYLTTLLVENSNSCVNVFNLNKWILRKLEHWPAIYWSITFSLDFELLHLF